LRLFIFIEINTLYFVLFFVLMVIFFFFFFLVFFILAFFSQKNGPTNGFPLVGPSLGASGLF
jgi:heme/copper-type cytochrome/quinol oxidase subunit 2